MNYGVCVWNKNNWIVRFVCHIRRLKECNLMQYFQAICLFGCIHGCRRFHFTQKKMLNRTVCNKTVTTAITALKHQFEHSNFDIRTFLWWHFWLDETCELGIFFLNFLNNTQWKDISCCDGRRNEPANFRPLTGMQYSFYKYNELFIEHKYLLVPFSFLNGPSPSLALSLSLSVSSTYVRIYYMLCQLQKAYICAIWVYQRSTYDWRHPAIFSHIYFIC